MLVGYMRVSSDSDRQTTDPHRDALLSAGVDSRHLTNLAAGDTSVGSTPRSLTENSYFNGHPDLIVTGFYPNDSVQSGSEGIEIKSTRKKGGKHQDPWGQSS